MRQVGEQGGGVGVLGAPQVAGAAAVDAGRVRQEHARSDGGGALVGHGELKGWRR